jgi:hypothetical protein
MHMHEEIQTLGQRVGCRGVVEKLRRACKGHLGIHQQVGKKDWLRAILPHLLVDPKMALACPPQLFYNTPASDPSGEELHEANLVRESADCQSVYKLKFQ